MRPGQQSERHRFDAANRPPNGGNAVTPDGGAVAKGREGDVMQQIKFFPGVQPCNDGAGGTLPKEIVGLSESKAAFQSQQKGRFVVINKFWQRLFIAKRGETGFDVGAIV